MLITRTWNTCLGLVNIAKCVQRMRCRLCCSRAGGYVRGLSVEELKRRMSSDVGWEDVVDALDFVFFWTFLLMILGITGGCCYIAYTGAL